MDYYYICVHYECAEMRNCATGTRIATPQWCSYPRLLHCRLASCIGECISTVHLWHTGKLLNMRVYNLRIAYNSKNIIVWHYVRTCTCMFLFVQALFSDIFGAPMDNGNGVPALLMHNLFVCNRQQSRLQYWSVSFVCHRHYWYYGSAAAFSICQRSI